jgi:glycerophosphoryl diester phosphodiesterase
MLNIIAHRGFWSDISEQNSELAFRKALENGFGIETDLRDFNQNIVISHDMPTQSCMTLDKFLALCAPTPELVLALNVKADGLQSCLLKSTIKNSHFFFDMSVPDMLGYKKNELNFFTRYSDIEQSPSLYNQCDGVWLDNFKDENLDVPALLKFLKEKKRVVLVSPELHKRCEKNYWATLKEILTNYPEYRAHIGMCTDFPLKAKGYFDGH